MPRGSGPYARQAKTTGMWTAQYRDATNRKRYTDPHRTKREAQRAAVIEEEQARRGQRRDPTSHRMSYESWVGKWWPTRAVESSTNRSDWPRMRNHVLPRWGQVRLSEIGHMDAQAWVLSLTREPQASNGNRPLAASTARHCLTLLSTSLTAAVREGVLDVNPCRELRLPDLPVDDERYLSDDEVDAIFDQLDGWRRLLVELLLDSGMRIGEATGLHRHRCHLERDDPHVSVIETWDPDDRLIKPHPKGKKRRDVAISERMADALEAYWAAHPDLPDTCGETHEDGSRCRSGLAIPNASGSPVDQSNFSTREWGEALALSGVEHCRPHDLRHTFASRAIDAGMTLEELQVVLGHVSYATTLKYAKLMSAAKDRRRRQREAMAARRAGSSSAAGRRRPA